MQLVEPSTRIPSALKDVHVTRRFRGKSYAIRMRRTGDGPLEIEVNGHSVAPGPVPAG